jgi:protein-S-isoprenylcysteine O-methyltransferase Ste14
LVLLGWACWLENGLSFLMLPLFVVYINRFQIVPEERHLQEKFGDEFADYAAKVRRWI